MSRQPLSSFIRSYVERRDEAEPTTTLEDEIRHFKSELDDLYRSVETWLSDAIEANDVHVSREPFELIEPTIAPYEADKLRIEIGDSTVLDITPVGRFIIGAKGRADFILVGSTEPPYRMVILPDEEGHDRWMLTSRPRRLAPTVLDRTCFEDAFRSLLEAEPPHSSYPGIGI